MNDFLTALVYDAAGKYEQAAVAYERVILQPQAPVEVFANLSFIYWESGTQQSIAAAEARPPALHDRPWQMCFRVIEAGLQQYPEDLELSFWARYYPYRGIFDDFSAADCQQLLLNCVNHNQTLIPYFFLSLFDEELYSVEIAHILADCRKCPTAKNRWIASVLGYKPYYNS
ncbi:MAG: hypothetical protein EOO56_21205 [Hymenobacter sp.]|nr:MAG: hypothetical protein EOO56_21205 [Hymenobacter sp.]